MLRASRCSRQASSGNKRNSPPDRWRIRNQERTRLVGWHLAGLSVTVDKSAKKSSAVWAFADRRQDFQKGSGELRSVECGCRESQESQ